MSKRILILLTILASLILLLTYTVFESDDIASKSLSPAFATETWIGLDCTTLDEELIPLCNDINALHDRTVELEQIKLVDLIETAPLVTYTDKITIPAYDSYNYTVQCQNGEYIMNVGYLTEGEFLPPKPKMDFFITWSYQHNESTWIYLLGNPTNTDVNMKIHYSCLG